MRIITTLLAAALLPITPAAALELLTEEPPPGIGRDFLDACWAAMGKKFGDQPLQVEAVFKPEFKPLPDNRLARYGLSKDSGRAQYGDTSFIVWTADNAGAAFPLSIRCEGPFDPAAPDFSPVFITEDQSTNPNIPPEERPPRD